ncbi:HAD family hydrolase [Glycomyces sp. NRRL B-16210]|uniref:HAD family hydrolase n=1 Tax=Glycomyces sp. NRRL B-16210 TaxID=1463821 RepID=UPI0004C00F72|nr:HAD family hydrolase [Glycomyces sp. NRRL B-16210]
MSASRVIATDLDGTLLAPGGRFTERAQSALAAAREQGIAVVAVTARPPRVFDEWTPLAASLDAAICANGAIVYAPAEREVLATTTLHAETAALAAKTLRAAMPEVRFAVETGFEVVAEAGYSRVDSVGDRRAFRGTLAAVFASAAAIVKLLAQVPNERTDTALRAARALELPGVAVAHSGGLGLLEIGPAGVSKATALARWCEARGIGPEAVAAFGDAPNDVPMLAWAGRSFAVANAHPEAAEAASDRCGSNREDGVAEAVEALVRECA